ncbi:Protein of unknown function [Lactobacillus delbrueckii subsp. bulgaricus]|nr:Protein of unknown function [Lactobacillus delbrueckii subsp. bulgaricus]
MDRFSKLAVSTKKF